VESLRKNYSHMSGRNNLQETQPPGMTRFHSKAIIGLNAQAEYE